MTPWQPHNIVAPSVTPDAARMADAAIFSMMYSDEVEDYLREQVAPWRPYEMALNPDDYLDLLADGTITMEQCVEMEMIATDIADRAILFAMGEK